MTRTFADMTPAERQECVGMWFEWKGTDYLVVLASLNGPFAGHVTVMIPHHIKARTAYTKMSTLIPRLDLPRVWTPSGEPVPGEWVESPSAEHFHRWCARWEKKPDGPATEEAPDPPQPGEAWLIEYEGKHYEAIYWYSPIYAHWAFVENREGLKTVESPEATPVSRMVPEEATV